MPTVQLFLNGETHTKQMPSPIKISRMEYWYKGARKVINQIPEAQYQLTGPTGWMIEHQEADVKWVKFDLLHRDGQRGYIVILRQS